MSETVYIETSIIGYLTARPSNNPILMANLEATWQWWETRRDHFTLYISQVVLDEVARVYGLDYLLTWNFWHIANAQIQKKLAQISLDAGYELLTICTPYELMGE